MVCSVQSTSELVMIELVVLSTQKNIHLVFSRSSLMLLLLLLSSSFDRIIHPNEKSFVETIQCRIDDGRTLWSVFFISVPSFISSSLDFILFNEVGCYPLTHKKRRRRRRRRRHRRRRQRRSLALSCSPHFCIPFLLLVLLLLFFLSPSLSLSSSPYCRLFFSNRSSLLCFSDIAFLGLQIQCAKANNDHVKKCMHLLNNLIISVNEKRRSNRSWLVFQCVCVFFFFFFSELTLLLCLFNTNFEI